MAINVSIRKDFENLMYARESRVIKLVKEKESLSKYLLTLDKYVHNDYYPNRSKLEKASTNKKIEIINHKLVSYTKKVNPKKMRTINTLNIYSTPLYILVSVAAITTNTPVNYGVLVGVPALLLTYREEKRRNTLNKAIANYNGKMVNPSNLELLIDLIKGS